MEVRVRFAPSPTGFLHVGGLRTALYNYLFAKHHKGKLILRIEDTDRTRFVENATENLIQNLRWAGIEFDESLEKGGEYGPYVQSARFDMYKQHAEQLIKNGMAYYAFDSQEELEAMRQSQTDGSFKYIRNEMKNSFTLSDTELQSLLDSDAPKVVRLKVPENEELVFNDIIRGEIKVPGKDIDDQILLKSDGYPTYHLANVVDDHYMKISHIIRGEEWLPSTPKHVILYRAFDWDVPEFAHLPLLLNESRQKLSKRHGDVAVEDFQAKGYLRDAFVNFIALLGWNPTGDREIYTMDELIEFFKLEKVNRAGAVFDLQKLNWMNAEYIKKASLDELYKQLQVLPDNIVLEDHSEEYIKNVIELFRERITFVADIFDIAAYMFHKPAQYDEQYKQKQWNEDSPEMARELLGLIKRTEPFDHENLQSAIKEYCTKKSIKMGVAMHSLRLMLTGVPSGASMMHTMELLGKSECIERIETFLELENKV